MFECSHLHNNWPIIRHLLVLVDRSKNFWKVFFLQIICDCSADPVFFHSTYNVQSSTFAITVVPIHLLSPTASWNPLYSSSSISILWSIWPFDLFSVASDYSSFSLIVESLPISSLYVYHPHELSPASLPIDYNQIHWYFGM